MSSELLMSQISQAALVDGATPTQTDATRRESRYGSSCFECRRRKVKCLPSFENPSQCKACARRGSRCVEQELAPARVGAMHRKKLSQRISRLEQIIQAMRREGKGGKLDTLLEEKVSTFGGSRKRLGLSSRSGSVAPTSPSEHSPTFSLNEDESLSSDTGREFVSVLDSQDSASKSVLELLVPSGTFKHQNTCKLLLKVLDSIPNIEQSLNRHSQFWAHNIRKSNPNATFREIDLKEYARQAIAGDNPIKIARIVQIAAEGAANFDLFQRIVLLVDRLVVHDNEYMSSIEGLECAFGHGRFFVEMGQMRSSWLHIRRVVSLLELYGVNRNQTSPREDWLWRMVFQIDHFLSLMVHTPMNASNLYCKVDLQTEPTSLTSSNYMDGMVRLAVLCGKVLNIIRNIQPVSYPSVMEIDQELSHFGSQLPAEHLSTSTPIPVHDGTGLLGRLGRKLAELNMMKLQLLQAKLSLHFPFMLKSVVDSSYEYSKSSCFDAAREILRLFQTHRTSKIIEKFFYFKTSPTDWIAYIAAASLILGQIAHVEEPHQLADDRKLADQVIQLYKGMPTKFAQQSHKVLRDLCALRDSPRDPSIPTKVDLPILGKVVVPSASQKTSSPVQSEVGAWVPTNPPIFAPVVAMGREMEIGTAHQQLFAPFDMENTYYLQPMPFTEAGLNFLGTPTVLNQQLGVWQGANPQAYPSFQGQNPFIINRHNNLFSP